MFTRLRRFAGVLLALALLPAVGGAAQCVQHGESDHPVEHPASDTPVNPHGHSAHRVGSAAVDAPVDAPVAASIAASALTEPSAAASSLTELSAAESSQVAADGCCPPAGMAGECSSAMGCSVMSATPDQRTLADAQTIARVIVADGVQQIPGPSRAPEVPPPRN